MFLLTACSGDNLNLINEGFNIEKLLSFTEAKNVGRAELVEYVGDDINVLVPELAGGNGEITIGDTIDDLYYKSWGFNRTLIDFLSGSITIEDVEADIAEMVEYHKLVITDAYLGQEAVLP